MGVLMRAHGLSCDNLRSLEIVTADGAVRTASREEHPDLFWAARGGGRGLGVVTSFEFDLHPLGPQVAMAQVLYPYADAGTGAARMARPDPSAARHGHPAVRAVEHPTRPGDPCGDARVQGRHGRGRVRRPSRRRLGGTGSARPSSGTPLMDMSGTVDYLDVQTGVDAAFPPGGRYFFKSHFVDALSDRAIEALLGLRRTPTQPGVADRHPDPRWRGLQGRRGRERLPPPWRPVQPELRRRLVGPGAGRRGDRVGPLVVGRHAARSPPAGCTSTSPDSTTKPTAARCTGRAPHASTASGPPTTPTAYSPPPRTGPEAKRRPAASGDTVPRRPPNPSADRRKS